MKKYVTVGILVLVCVLFTGCTKKETDELVMVTEAGFAPYEYYKGQEIVGVDIDIAKEIAAAMDKKLVVKDVAFDSIVNEIRTGKADFAAAGMSITPEREKQVDFSIEYATSKQVVMVREDSSIHTEKDLHGKKIAVQLGTIADTYVSKTYRDSTLIQQKKYLSAIEDLKRGKVDCVVMDSLPAEEVLKTNTGLKLLEEPLFTDQYGMIVKKGNTELLKEINQVLERLMKNKKIEAYTISHLNS